MAASDVAALCIFLEQCGFLTDPAPMVADLYAAVAARVTMTVSDAEIYSFAKLRHRQRICLQAAERLDAMADQRAWRSAHSYRFECLTRGDQVAMLTVQGAKWRERPRIEITCPDCDMCYTKGDPESAQSHRREHTRVTRLLLPRPSRRMRLRLEPGAGGERVDANAPVWMHHEVYERAVRFKRDFGYDFIQWHTVSKRADIDPAWVGYLFAAPDGAIDGACAFRQSDGEWVLGWVWIRPERRRCGLLAARWPAFIARHGDFWIEHTLSDAMLGFIARHATEGQRRKIVERIRAPEPLEFEKCLASEDERAR